MNSLKKLFSSSLFKEFSFYSTSTLFYQISRVLVELAVAKILGPTLWGIWYFLNLAIAYRSLTYFGIVNGMNREIPINLGKEKEDKAQKLQDVTFTVVFITSLASCILFALIALFIHDPALVSAILWLIPLFFSTQFFFLVDASLRALSRFNEVSKIKLLFAVSFPLTAIPLTLGIGMEGFILGYTLATLVSAWVIYKKTNISYSFISDWALSKELIRIGFPIMAVGITYTFLNTADRWIIGMMLGAEQLGYYSMAIIVFGGMTLLPKLVSQQLYPRMAFDWGKTGSREDLIHWSGLQTKYTTYLVIPLLIGVLTIFPWVIRTWLPEYEAGILPLQIIVFGPLFMPFSAGWGNVLNIIDKQVYYLGIIVTAIIINLMLNYLFVIYGFGIAGVAFGTALTFAIYSIAIMFVGKYFVGTAETLS